VPCLFLILILTGITVYKDYGITWDEEPQREIGMVALKEISKKTNIKLFNDTQLELIPNISTYKHRDYGPLIEMLLVSLEKIFNVKEFNEIFLLRHLSTYLLFVLGLYFFFKISQKRFNYWKIAVFSLFLLYLTPRIFGNAFYNTKDIGFLTIYTISIYSLQTLFFEKKPFLFHCMP
jgi:hypothetical protein